MEKRTFVSLALGLVIQICIACGGGGSLTTPVSPTPAVAPLPPAAPTAQPSVPQPSVPWPTGYTLTAVSLSGTVFETTSTGRVPIPGARVYCELCGTETHTFAVTDSNGFYIFPSDLSSGGGIWLSGRRTPIFVENRGYKDPDGLPFFQGTCPNGFSCLDVLIEGNTQFDVELVRLSRADAASEVSVLTGEQP